MSTHHLIIFHARKVQRSSGAGFTLTELLTAIVISVIATYAIVNLFSAINISQRNVWYEDVATRAARAEIENARAKGVAQLAPGDTDISSRLPSSLPSGATGTLSVGSVFAGKARIVTVAITWQNGQKKVVLTGTVGQQGLLP